MCILLCSCYVLSLADQACVGLMLVFRCCNYAVTGDRNQFMYIPFWSNQARRAFRVSLACMPLFTAFPNLGAVPEGLLTHSVRFSQVIISALLVLQYHCHMYTVIIMHACRRSTLAT